MTRYAMAVDTVRCVGCSACVLACAEENQLPDDAYRCWITTETRGKFPVLTQEIRSERCNHCTDAPCVSACPTGASQVTIGGIVVVDHEMCTGCKACMGACPYDARYVHPDGYVDKCTFCVHRVERGLDPACVSNCPTNALIFGDLDDPQSEVSRLKAGRRAKVNKPESGADPNVVFLL